MIHEDNRRTLIDWSDRLPIEAVKTVVANEDCELGNHYHKIKTERFMMIRGEIICKIEKDPPFKMQQFKAVKIKPGVTHTFKMKKGSILQCLTDKKYDPKDDYAGT